MPSSDYLIPVIMAILCIALFVVVGLMIYYGEQQDMTNIIKVSIALIIIVFVYTILMYIYFNSNPAYTPMFLTAASGISITISIIAITLTRI